MTDQVLQEQAKKQIERYPTRLNDAAIVALVKTAQEAHLAGVPTQAKTILISDRDVEDRWKTIFVGGLDENGNPTRQVPSPLPQPTSFAISMVPRVGPPTPFPSRTEEWDVVRFDTGKETARLLVVVNRDGTVPEVRPVDKRYLAVDFRTYGNIAVGLFLKELLADDSDVAALRIGCSRIARGLLFNMPELATAVSRNILSAPRQDASILALARATYEKQYDSAVDPGTESKRTLGRDPKFTLVYYDQDNLLNDALQLAIVRAGDDHHVYLPLYISKDGGARASARATCLDDKAWCASFSGWP